MVNLIKNQSYFLYFILVVKLILSSLFGSYFLTSYFIPFSEFFINSGFGDPYEHFMNQGFPKAFPYPALMLYILALPQIFLNGIYSVFPWNLNVNLIIYRLPLLLADISIFFILKSWLSKNLRWKLSLIYWASPIAIYVSYIHGQLDAIPIAFLMGSLFFLFKNQFFKSALLLGLGISTKTNILLAAPFIGLYLISKRLGLYKTIQFFLIMSLVFLILNLPFLFSSSFVEMVFMNIEQKKIFQAAVHLGDYKLLLAPASLLILFFKASLFKNFGKDIFIMLLGFSFCILLIFIPPMPGWYFWIIPFLSYFFTKSRGRSIYLFIGLQISYLVYFFILSYGDQIFEFYGYSTKSFSEIHFDLTSLAFTCLQTLLILTCFWIYSEGLRVYSKYKLISRPFLLGIGGSSGAGKTTISESLTQIFQPKNVTQVKGDDMHKWQRGHENWKKLTHLNPKANTLHKEVNFLKKLKSGRKISRQKYDHSSGEFTKEINIFPNNLIIFEGLHPFYIQTQREVYDLKIFIHPDKELTTNWKVQRDQKSRGYQKEKILEQIKFREKDVQSYIQHQQKYCDIIISPYKKTFNKTSNDYNLDYKLMIKNSIYIEDLVERLNERIDPPIKHFYGDEDFQEVHIFSQTNIDLDISPIYKKFTFSLDELGVNQVQWPKGSFGMLLLFLVFCILEEAKSDTSS